MSSKKLIIGTLILSLVLGLAYLMHDKFERISEDIETGFTGEARSNSLYASRLFLKAMGIPAQTIKLYDLDRLPSADTVIVINTYRGTLSVQRIEGLLEWVRDGGHLLTIGVPDHLQEDDYRDELQRQLNIGVADTQFLSFNKDKQKNKNKNKDKDKNKKEEKPNVSLRLTGLDKRYQLMISRFNPLKSNITKEEKIQINQQNFLLNRPYGSGMVSLIADLSFAENKQIEKHDHAEFFWQLIHRQHTSPRNVWLLNSDDMPPLWKWLWQYGSAFIISLSLLALLWLYKLSQRFGPLIPHQTLDRRRILEHIQASGHFLWRHDQQQLIQSSRQSVQNRFEALFPAWHQLDQSEQLQCVSEYSQLSTDELRRLLYEDKKLTVDEFIHFVQQLEKLRKD